MIDGVIIKGVGGAYTVSTAEGEFVCNARGVFRNRQITPIIGDYVEISVIRPADGSEATGTVHRVKPRKNELRRPRAANVDLAVVTAAAVKPDFNPGLLDRYLMLIEQARIPAVICLNKCDLASEASVRDIARVYGSAGYPFIPVSAASGLGLTQLQIQMRDKISVFAGPSGVGKSSLINQLCPEAARETGEISVKIARGRHTTRHTQMLPLTGTGFCIDTPGFSALTTDDIAPAQYAGLFREFLPFLGQCRFSDCRHLTENDCAVKEQVGITITPQRYESYVYMMKNRVR